jgi:uncharacterized protein
MKLWGGLLIGVAAGILAGMVGVGGGLIVVPALVYLMGMDQHTAQGTSLAILLPPTGILAFWKYYQAGHVDMRIAGVIILGVVLGGYLGGSWAQQLSGPILRKSFAALMLIAAINMWFERGR